MIPVRQINYDIIEKVKKTVLITRGAETRGEWGGYILPDNLAVSSQ